MSSELSTSSPRSPLHSPSLKGASSISRATPLPPMRPSPEASRHSPPLLCTQQPSAAGETGSTSGHRPCARSELPPASGSRAPLNPASDSPPPRWNAVNKPNETTAGQEHQHLQFEGQTPIFASHHRELRPRAPSPQASQAQQNSLKRSSCEANTSHLSLHESPGRNQEKATRSRAVKKARLSLEPSEGAPSQISQYTRLSATASSADGQPTTPPSPAPSPDPVSGTEVSPGSQKMQLSNRSALSARHEGLTQIPSIESMLLPQANRAAASASRLSEILPAPAVGPEPSSDAQQLHRRVSFSNQPDSVHFLPSTTISNPTATDTPEEAQGSDGALQTHAQLNSLPPTPSSGKSFSGAADETAAIYRPTHQCAKCGRTWSFEAPDYIQVLRQQEPGRNWNDYHAKFNNYDNERREYRRRHDDSLENWKETHDCISPHLDDAHVIEAPARDSSPHNGQRTQSSNAVAITGRPSTEQTTGISRSQQSVLSTPPPESQPSPIVFRGHEDDNTTRYFKLEHGGLISENNPVARVLYGSRANTTQKLSNDRYNMWGGGTVRAENEAPDAQRSSEEAASRQNT